MVCWVWGGGVVPRKREQQYKVPQGEMTLVCWRDRVRGTEAGETGAILCIMAKCVDFN